MTTNVFDICRVVRSRVVKKVEQDLKVEVFYDNEPGNPPADMSSFIVASIKPTQNVKQEVGVGSSYRQGGLLMLMIMTEGGKGDKAALKLAASCVDAFKSVTDDGVVFRTPSPEVIGVNRNGWWQVNVNCPFYAESK